MFDVEYLHAKTTFQLIAQKFDFANLIKLFKTGAKKNIENK